MNTARMIVLGLLQLMAATASGSPVDTVSQAIVNGSRAPRAVGLKPGEILAIGALTNFNDPTESFCTGTLITNRVVVTAAHCIARKNGSVLTAGEISFVVGEDPSVNGTLFGVANVQVHPQYNPQSNVANEPDVAILTLDQNANALVPDIVPIEFNRHPLTGLDAEALVDRTVEIGGYGETRSDERGRFFTSLPIISISDLTLAIDGRGLTGACGGDSGGPILTLNMRGTPVILGVLRGGSDDCVSRDNYVRLDVESIREWLEEQISMTWPTYPVGALCDNLTFHGRCVAEHVEYCGEDFLVKRKDCLGTSRQQTCSFINLEAGYDCRDISTCETLPCKSRFDGFLPPAPYSIVNVGGCIHGSDRPFSGWFMGLLVGIFAIRKRWR